MYEQWNQVMTVHNAAFDALKEPASDSMYSSAHIEQQKAIILGGWVQSGSEDKKLGGRLIYHTHGECRRHQKESSVYQDLHQWFYS